jgi:CO/xanthine dehydrogenase FAD-binding subunit
MKYYRPEKVEEAIKLLAQGVPLSGGTSLTPKRRSLEAVIDLEKLGMDQIKIDSEKVGLGAATKLQDLIEVGADLPDHLTRACRLEAAWNLRNMATMAGTIMAGEGRSPLLVVLLALGTEVTIHDESDKTPLNVLLDRRDEGGNPFLITELTFDIPNKLRYEYVARAPTDRPLVSAAAALSSSKEGLKVAIGGFGKRPRLLNDDRASSISEWKKLAAEQYADAGDAFASSAYRSEVAAVLVERVLKEVQS